MVKPKTLFLLFLRLYTFNFRDAIIKENPVISGFLQIRGGDQSRHLKKPMGPNLAQAKFCTGKINDIGK